MQPTDGFSIARRALDVEDYIDIVRRHKGWIFGPFLFCLVASVVGVYLWPDSYSSTCLVKITPQQVPDSMVQSSVRQEMFDRVMSMEQEILSRGVLTNIINTNDLYKRERLRVPIEDILDDMRSKIHVDPVVGANPSSSRSVPAFSIRFSYPDRYLAQRVVQDLAGRFIAENVRNSSNQTFQTTQFMKDEEEQARKDLDEVENKLTVFRVQNNGRLPDQVQGMMQSMQALQAQVTTFDAAISRANQEKLQLESNLRIVRDRLTELNKQPPVEMSALTAQRNERLAEADREIQQWEDMLRNLRQKYSDNYPDVQTVQGRLEAAKQKRADIVKDDAAKKEAALKEDAKREEARKAGKAEAVQPRPENPAVASERRSYETSAKQIQSQIEGKDLEIQEFNKQMKHASDSIRAFQARVDAVPLGDKEYNDLLRDRDVAKQRYLEDEQKLEKAQIAQTMETRKQGELLELLDPASLPATPTEPKRPIVISIGAALGLLLGAMIAGAREMKDTSLKNLKDVRAYTQIAILGSIPLLENDFVVRRRKRLSWLGWTTACLAAVVIMSGSVVYYYVTKV